MPGESAGWDAAYAGTPPWDTGRPQPEIVRLAEQGLLSGRLLDSGCGTGEHALLAAAFGCDALGIDASPRAIGKARAKAAERGVAVRFEVGDVLALAGEAAYDTVVDSGVFHVFGDEDRATYVTGLSRVTRPGGLLMLLCFSDTQPGTWGPRRVRGAELTTAFAQGWTMRSLQRVSFELSGHPPDAQAWLALLERTSSTREGVPGPVAGAPDMREGRCCEHRPSAGFQEGWSLSCRRGGGAGSCSRASPPRGLRGGGSHRW